MVVKDESDRKDRARKRRWLWYHRARKQEQESRSKKAGARKQDSKSQKAGEGQREEEHEDLGEKMEHYDRKWNEMPKGSMWSSVPLPQLLNHCSDEVIGAAAPMGRCPSKQMIKNIMNCF